jgi:hypothetical protein
MYGNCSHSIDQVIIILCLITLDNYRYYTAATCLNLKTRLLVYFSVKSRKSEHVCGCIVQM